MTRQETLAIMSVLKAAYPAYYRDMKREEANAVVDLWTAMLNDYSAQEVTVAVKAHIATDKKGFPPHIGAIIDAIQKTRQKDDMTEIEAWGYIDRATRNASYYAREEFDKLPPILQRLVRSPQQLKDWALMDRDTLQSVVASNFQRSFRARAQHEREYLSLPSDVREQMALIAESMKLPMLEERK